MQTQVFMFVLAGDITIFRSWWVLPGYRSVQPMIKPKVRLCLCRWACLCWVVFAVLGLSHENIWCVADVLVCRFQCLKWCVALQTHPKSVREPKEKGTKNILLDKISHLVRVCCCYVMQCRFEADLNKPHDPMSVEATNQNTPLNHTPKHLPPKPLRGQGLTSQR